MKFERKGKARKLNAGEINEILNTLKEPHHTIFSIQRYTGCRIGEVIQIKKKDINLNNNRINLEIFKTKGKKEYRQLLIHDKLYPVLKTYIDTYKPINYLFTGKTKGKINPNKHITAQSCDKALRLACLYLDIEGVSTHSFRRTVIKNIWDKMEKKDARLLASFTGHKSINSLFQYLEVTEEEKDILIDYL